MYEQLATQRGADRLNAVLPRPKRSCPKCGGTGHYYDPPEQVQREQIEAGTREFTVGRVCTCAWR